MKHLKSVSRTTTPAAALSLMEWSQVGAVVGTFVTAFNNFITALGNLFKLTPPEKG